MAAIETAAPERRRECRYPGGGTRWRSQAILRPGQPVTLLNISSQAALVESSARLRPGARAEIQLAGPDAHVSVVARLDRCCVAALEPIRYRGVVLFEQCVKVSESFD